MTTEKKLIQENKKLFQIPPRILFEWMNLASMYRPSVLELDHLTTEQLMGVLGFKHQPKFEHVYQSLKSKKMNPDYAMFIYCKLNQHPFCTFKTDYEYVEFVSFLTIFFNQFCTGKFAHQTKLPEFHLLLNMFCSQHASYMLA